MWLGYVGVDDVDATVAPLSGGRRQGADAGLGHARGRPHRDGHRSAGRAILHDDADSAGEPTKQRRGVFSVDQPQHVRWNELSTTDPEAAPSHSTARHFGWRQEGDMDMGEMGKYQFLYHGDVMIGAVMPKMPQMPVSLWSYYIGVDDIDRAAEAVDGGGGQILVEPMEIPGGEYSLNALDPQGAAFGLVGPRKSEEEEMTRQDDHLPVVRQRRGAQGRGILRRDLPRQLGRQGDDALRATIRAASRATS